MDKDWRLEKARNVIGDALARTMYDTPPHYLQPLRDEEENTDDCVRGIAERMVRVLGYDRWQMKGPPRRDDSTLEGFLFSSLRRAHLQNLASMNTDVAKVARMEAVDHIIATLRDARVTLIQWRRR